MKILLLNPPGRKKYNRDYYCGETSKGRYVFPPTDLLVLSGLLRGHCHIHVVDAMAEGLKVNEAMERICEYDPDLVISLASSVSWSEDVRFFSQLRRSAQARVLVTGDMPRAVPQFVLDQEDSIDGVILDFTDCDILAFASGRAERLKNIFTRKNKVAAQSSKVFAYAIPQHEIFPLKYYHHPLLSVHPYTTIITDYSCPYACTFCPYERIPYKRRDLENVREELEHIYSLGIRGLLINDASFGASIHRGLAVCSMLSQFPERFRWICDMRVDHARPRLLERMKEAGCEVVQFGVETATQGVLERVRKGISEQQVRQAFALARRMGLRTLAHVILGLPGETFESQLRLLDFILELDPDYVSFNLAVPAWGTSFREELVALGVIEKHATGFDVSGKRPLWVHEGLKAQDVAAIRLLGIWRFYFRPGYIWRRLLSVRSLYEVRNLLVQGFELLRP